MTSDAFRGNVGNFVDVVSFLQVVVVTLANLVGVVAAFVIIDARAVVIVVDGVVVIGMATLSLSPLLSRAGWILDSTLRLSVCKYLSFVPASFTWSN